VCDARTLHSYLGSKQDYSTWIKGWIKKYGFVEDQDYVLHKFMERQNQGLIAGQVKIDYHLTLDMANALNGVEQTPRVVPWHSPCYVVTLELQ